MARCSCTRLDATESWSRRSRALWRPDGGVIVEATVTPIGQAPGDTVTRPFAFTTTEQAARFVDEALLALEYLDCEIVE